MVYGDLVTDGMRMETLEPERGMTRDIQSIASKKHVMHGLIEVDVTDTRRRLGHLSLTAFLIHCVAIALSGESRLNAVRRGRRVYTFDRVNVGMMIEGEEAGHKKVGGLIIRDADVKSVVDIHTEIREAQRRPISDLERGTGYSWALHMPGFVRRAAMRYMLRSPAIAHRMGLAVGVTAVGMFGRGAGWGLTITPCTVAVTVGGIGHRAVPEGGQAKDHEFLCLTVSFDHDLVDGAPAARFTARLGELIEQGHGLMPGLAETA